MLKRVERTTQSAFDKIENAEAAIAAGATTPVNGNEAIDPAKPDPRNTIVNTTLAHCIESIAQNPPQSVRK